MRQACPYRRAALRLYIEAELAEYPEERLQLLLRAAHWQDLALHREFLKRNPYPGGGAPPPAIAQLLAMRTGLEAGSSLAA